MRFWSVIYFPHMDLRRFDTWRMMIVVSWRVWGMTSDGDGFLPIAPIAAVRTIRLWFRELIDQSDKAKKTGLKLHSSKENENEIVRLATENGCGNDVCGAKCIVEEVLTLVIKRPRYKQLINDFG
jgi:hypothetical protein